MYVSLSLRVFIYLSRINRLPGGVISMTSDNEFMADFTYKMGEQYTMDIPVGLAVLNPHFIKNKLSIKLKH